jgi:hypothetical protein
MAQLKTDNDELSNRLAAAESRKLPEAQMQELLKLRGETSLLKKQLAGAGVSAERAAVRSAVGGGQDDAERQAAIHKLNGAKILTAAAMFGFSGSRDGDFPTNWGQMEGRFDEWERRGLNPGDPMPDTTADFNEMTNLFALVYQGSMSNLYGAANFPNVIVLREKDPWQSSNGNWLRTYGFADGHSEVHSADNGDFGPWESQHVVVPSGGQ